tara:strand:- start:737 stop:961 length:225 start_codon:yes stop_codon:yes gene_type:complete
MPEPFEFDPERKVATGNGLTITRLCDGDMCRVRAIKGIGGGATRRVEWLRVLVGDVRVYVGEGHVIVSKEDMLP